MLAVNSFVSSYHQYGIKSVVCISCRKGHRRSEASTEPLRSEQMQIKCPHSTSRRHDLNEKFCTRDGFVYSSQVSSACSCPTAGLRAVIRKVCIKHRKLCEHNVRFGKVYTAITADLSPRSRNSNFLRLLM